jgi:nucleoside-diphosphate-sugar epimerase
MQGQAGRAWKEMETVPKVALIVGVTGIVGNALADQLAEDNAPGGPWKVYGLARRPKPNWLNQSNLIYIQCNLLERKQTLAKLSPLHDVTHIFYVTWVNRDTEEESCEANGGMLRNVVDGLLPNAKQLQHIVLQTGEKHYVGPFEYFGKVSISNLPFREDSPRLPCPNFYYTLEDIVFDTVKQKQGLTYSVHRPNVIFGFTAGSLMNLVCTLAVYASICKYEGKPLIFPGNRICWEQFFDASDASLIAEQEIWACLDPKAKNQAFNISNGDVYTWKRLWYLLAEKYELQVPEYKGEPTSLSEMMKGKEQVWDKIVQENGLQPLKLLDVVGEWWFADIMLNQPLENMSSMNKSREYGFLSWRDSEKSFVSAIEKARKNKLVL